jgi:carnitine 3-dehydrogenase
VTEHTGSRQKVAVIGGGVIGGGWAARFALHGWDVAVFDPHPDAAERIADVVDNARSSLPALADFPMPDEGNVTMVADLASAVSGASWVQESVPEDLALKHAVFAEIQPLLTEDVLIGSSTSGFKPSELQQGSSYPEQILVAHPFNPVYLLPLVEIVAGAVCDEGKIRKASDVLRSIGMHPLLVRNEIDAHLADRFMEAVWREALWLVNDDIATTEEIDNAIRYGFGLRWAQMGLFETFRLAGGEEGMAHFIRQFGPALKWPWTKLMDVPELTETLVQKVASQSDAQSGEHSIRELERIRDRNLVGILRSLKERDFGAGSVLLEHDRRLAALLPETPVTTEPGPMRLLDLTVLPGWIDYNGHMTEFRYIQVFSDSCEALLRRVGMHDEYVEAGNSWYTAETHTQFFDELAANEPMYTTAQILDADAKRLHVFYRLHASADDRLLASLEAMYLHVNMTSGKVCEADADACRLLNALAAEHAELPPPGAAGRSVGQR